MFLYYALRRGYQAQHDHDSAISGWSLFHAAAAYLTDWSIYAVFLVGQFVDVIKMFLALYLVQKEGWVKNVTVAVDVSDLEEELAEKSKRRL